MDFEPLEEGRIPQQAVFEDLSKACPHLAVAETVQNGQVGQHQTRLMERPDQILAARGIDGRLAAHGGVDLC